MTGVIDALAMRRKQESCKPFAGLQLFVANDLIN
jgi:hypothetical protein